MQSFFKIFILTAAVGLMLSCNKQNSNELYPFPQAIVDSAAYNQVVFQPAILDASILGDFLTIRFGQSGCTDQFEFIQLFDANVIAKSNPPQRYIRLSVPPTGMCGAYWVREVSFQLQNLRINGTNTIFLNLEGYSQRLEYHY